ncbi:MAG: DUF4236 domain-containing protein [Chthoniobacterales bacterium]
MFKLRFRKKVKLAPGLALNFSKGGVSLSVGGRGNSVNVGKRGVKQTVGLPGTGISFSNNHSWSKVFAQSREVNSPRKTGRLQHLSEPVFRNQKEQQYYQSKLTDEIGQKAVSLLTPYETRIWRQLSGRTEAAITDPSCYSKAELNVICKWLKLAKQLIDSGWAPEPIDQPRLELTKADSEPQQELTLRPEELQPAQLAPPLPQQAAPLTRPNWTVRLFLIIAGVLIVFQILAHWLHG